MLLYPDIEFDNNKISIQPPYTLNGVLINKYIDLGQHDDYFSIINENGYQHVFRKDSFVEKYNYIYHRNLGRRFEDDLQITYSFPSADEYFELVREQCVNFSSNRNNFISRLKRQRRADHYQDSFVSRYFDERSYSFTVDNAAINLDLLRGQLGSPSGVWATYSPSNEVRKKYIHSFNYKPEYIKHYMPNEDNSSLLLGAEIEVAGNSDEPDRETTVKKCIQIMNGSEDDAENLIYSTYDSTVQIELDTMPCTLEFHKNKMNYKELFKYLDGIGYKGHDCENAGLHIHADRSYLGKSELKQQLVITKILYILEKFNNEICVIARRDHEYSKFVGDKNNEKSVVELYNKYKNTGKRVALNLQHDNTIEFRCFKSTLKYETFILTLEFVKDIIDYAKSINIEEIELIQWDDLMNTFSKELKDYYNKRLEKEKDKNLTVDMLKKQIKSLNKRISNCVNYLESSRLRKELNNKERKLKELEKKEKKKNISNRRFYTAEQLASIVADSLATTCDCAATASPITPNEARSAIAYSYDLEQRSPYISYGNNRIYATSADLSALNSSFLSSSLNY